MSTHARKTSRLIGRYSNVGGLSGLDLPREGKRAGGKIEIAHGHEVDPYFSFEPEAAGKGEARITRQRRSRVAINAQTDALEYEARRGRISAAAYEAGRYVDRVLEAASGRRTGREFGEADRAGFSAFALQQAMVARIDAARKAGALKEAMAREIGPEIGADHREGDRRKPVVPNDRPRRRDGGGEEQGGGFDGEGKGLRARRAGGGGAVSRRAGAVGGVLGEEGEAGVRRGVAVAKRPVEWYIAALRSFRMIASFRDGWLRDFFVDDLRSKKIPSELESRLFRKLQMIDDAAEDRDLRVPPSNHFEKLLGDLEGFYSIRVNQQWRLIFRWDGAKGEASGVYLDDHSYR